MRSCTLIALLVVAMLRSRRLALRQVVFAIAIVYVMIVSMVMATLGTVFQTGLYVYATTGKAPASMDPALLQAAFRKK